MNFLNIFSIYGSQYFARNNEVISMLEYNKLRAEVESKIDNNNVYFNDIVHFRLEMLIAKYRRRVVIISLIILSRNLIRFIYRIFIYYYILLTKEQTLVKQQDRESVYFIVEPTKIRHLNKINELIDVAPQAFTLSYNQLFGLNFSLKYSIQNAKNLFWSNARDCASDVFLQWKTVFDSNSDILKGSIFVESEGRSTWKRIIVHYASQNFKSLGVFHYWYVDIHPRIPNFDEIYVPKDSYVTKAYSLENNVTRINQTSENSQILEDKIFDRANDCVETKFGILLGDPLGRRQVSIEMESRIIQIFETCVNPENIFLRPHPQLHKFYNKSSKFKIFRTAISNISETLFWDSVNLIVACDFNSSMVATAIHKQIKVLIIIPEYDSDAINTELKIEKYLKFNKCAEDLLNIVSYQTFCENGRKIISCLVK